MTEKKWYRVIDPINPLYGCDVNGTPLEFPEEFRGLMDVRALRRVDIFVGDRPFQLVAPEGETLGLLISTEHLGECPMQDEIVELVTDRPYGKCLNESQMKRPDGCTFSVAEYEHAVQAAILSSNSSVVATRTLFHTTDKRSSFDGVIDMFAAGVDVYEIKVFMQGMRN
jgi:hypothetical protein